MRFAGGLLALVRVSGVHVSVIARCPQGESRLYYASVIPAAPSTPPPQTTAGHLPALSVPGVGHLQILFCLGAGHLSTPGPLASFWHARSFLSEYIYTEGFTGKKADWLTCQGQEKILKRVIKANLVPRVLSYPPYVAGRREPWERGCVKACSRFYAYISSLLIKPELHSENRSYRCESTCFGYWIKFLLILYEEHLFIFI